MEYLQHQQIHKCKVDKDSQSNYQMRWVVPRDQKRCEAGRVRKGFWRKEAGSSLERGKAPEEGVMGQVTEGRTVFQSYQGSGESRGNQMPSVGGMSVFLLGEEIVPRNRDGIWKE